MLGSLEDRLDRTMHTRAPVFAEAQCASGEASRVREMRPKRPEAVFAPACVHDTKRPCIDEERQRHEPGDHVAMLRRPERVLRQEGIMLVPVLVIVRTDKPLSRRRGVADGIELVIAHHG